MVPRKKLLKIISYLLFLPLHLSAQINESDTLNFQANLSLSGVWQGGNVQTLIFRAKSDITYTPWKKWVYKTKNSYVYQAFGKQKADEDILSLNFLYFNPKRVVYPLLLGFVGTNFRRQIDLRYLVGVGATFQVLQKKDNWLKLSISSEYEETDFKTATFNRADYNVSPTIKTLRSTLWINGKHPLLKDKVVLTHESFFQPSVSQGDNFRWRLEAGLNLPLWKFLDFNINYLHTYESIVIENQKLEDQFLTFGFTIKNY